MKSLLYLALGFVLLLQPDAYAQKHTATDANVFGDVQSNGEHIPFATILVEGLSIGTAADASGHYHLSNLPVGKLRLRASAVGYRPQFKEVNLVKGESMELNFRLEEDVIMAEQVVITASRNAQSRKDAPVVVNTISPHLLEATNAVSLAEGLNFSPGLRVENDCQNCGFNQLRLNGLDGPYTQILINSRPIFSALNGVYGLEQIPANMIDRIEVVRGGGSALYGANAIGGTVNVITKDPLTNAFELNNQTSLIGGKALEETFSMSLSQVTNDYRAGIFAFGMYRNRQPYDANGDGFSEITKLKNRSLGLRAYYRTSDYSKLTLDLSSTYEFRRGGNRFEYRPDQADIAEQLEHDIVSGGLSWDVFSRNEKDRFSIYTSAQSTQRDSYYGVERDPAAYGYTSDYSVVSGAQYTRKIDHPDWLHAHSEVVLGVENVYNQLEDIKLGYTMFDTVAMKEVHLPNTTITSQGVNSLGVYAQDEIDFHAVKVLLGVRYDRADIQDFETPNNKVSSYSTWSPRINVLYRANDDLQFRASYAHGFRPPQVFDEDLHITIAGAQGIRTELSPDLKPETSVSYTLSAEYSKSKKSKGFQFNAEGFYTLLNNPFLNELSEQDNGELLYIKRNATSGAFVAGVNAELKYIFSRQWDVQFGFTLQQAKYEESQMWGDEVTSTSKEILRTPNNYGFWVMNYKPNKAWNFALSGVYTGPMYAPHLPGGIAPDGSLIEHEVLEKTPVFFDASFKMSYMFFLGEKLNMQLSAGVQNILNAYQDDFDRGVGRDAGYIYGPQKPITVFFGLKIGNLLL